VRSKIIAALSAALLFVAPSAHSVSALKMDQIPTVFAELTKDKALANPAVVLIDIKSGQIVYSRDANSQRKPASTLKVISAMSILEYMQPESTFDTAIYKTDIKNTFQVVGDFDPSITPSYSLAKSDKFVWSNYLVNKIRSASKSRHITIRYYGLTSRTQINMANYFRQMGYRVSWKPLPQAASLAHTTELLSSQTSPPLSNILRHTLLWSDNEVADYLARYAALKAGYQYSEKGIEPLFQEVLVKNNVQTPSINVKDGSGLSSSNRLSAMTLAQALLKIYQEPKFESVIKGLPVGGVSGTLKNRFLKTAPQGVGLVRAKTGTLNGVVNLAGYIDSGEHEYAFVILADHVRHSYYSEKAARAAVDKILGKIAQPLIHTPTQTAQEQSQTPITDVTN